MHRLPVESSDIVSVGYDPAAGTLEVEFHGGRVYQYREVPAEMYEQLMRADSHGQYFNTFIHGHFRYDRLQAAAATGPKAIAVVGSDKQSFADLRTACESLGIAVEQLTVPVDEVQSHDAEEIVTKKAKHAYHLAGRPVIVRTIFWNIVALHGFPGAYMRAVQEWLKPDDLLKLLADKADRSVVVTHTVAYYDGKRLKLFAGDGIGTVAVDASEDRGMSLEQLVMPIGQKQSLIDAAVWQELARWLHMQRRLHRA